MSDCISVPFAVKAKPSYKSDAKYVTFSADTESSTNLYAFSTVGFPAITDEVWYVCFSRNSTQS